MLPNLYLPQRAYNDCYQANIKGKFQTYPGYNDDVLVQIYNNHWRTSAKRNTPPSLRTSYH